MSYRAIISDLDVKYKEAVASGSLHFFPSDLTIHTENGIDFQVRTCPALLRKPVISTIKDHEDITHVHHPPVHTKNDFDPFEPPYSPGLFVADLTEDDEQFAILLNKYSVVEKHFLLVTKDFQPQTAPPTPTELLVAFKLLQAAKEQDLHIFAFYNCGDRSGSSQKHKHLQFLPIPDPTSGPPVEVVAKKQAIEREAEPFSISALPYANFIKRFSGDISKTSNDNDVRDVLTDAFMQVYDAAVQVMRQQDPQVPIPDGPMAYNVILTLDHLHLIPRLHAEYTMSNGQVLAINSLGFAGMLLAKTEQEKEVLLKDGILHALKSVSVVHAEGPSCSQVESSLS